MSEDIHHLAKKLMTDGTIRKSAASPPIVRCRSTVIPPAPAACCSWPAPGLVAPRRPTKKVDARFQWVSVGFSEFQWVSVGFSGFRWIVVSCGRLWWVVVDCDGFSPAGPR